MKNIGGQAVIEGVMMKSPDLWAVAVRDPHGKINLKTEQIKKRGILSRLPLFRGVFALGSALIIGLKAIEFSGTVAYQETKEDKPMTKSAMILTMGLAFVLAIGLFKFLPLLFATLMGYVTKGISDSLFLFNLLDGIFRIMIFFLYVFLIGLWKDMKRIYQYHGAEHKVIYAFEAGEELSVENAKKYRPYHPRCGTSFLLIVMIISIMTFMLIPKDWSFFQKLASRIVLIPLIAGISYEILRLSAKKKDNFIMGLLVLPGLFLQRLTVKEPDESQIEVAIAALKEVLRLSETEKI
jgi:uncharacterized protein YqhQ